MIDSGGGLSNSAGMMTRTTRALLLLLIGGTFFTTAAKAEDWYRWRGPDLNGISKETGWHPKMDFEPGLKATVDWYRANSKWVWDVKSGEYQSYYAKNYENRASELNQVRS